MKTRFRTSVIILCIVFITLLFTYIARIFDSSNNNYLKEKWMQIDQKAKVVIYTKPTCGYCIKAKNFFTEKRIKFEEIDVEHDNEKREELIEQTGSKTVPLIFINDTYIGGCTDMLAMAEDGKLYQLLAN